MNKLDWRDHQILPHVAVELRLTASSRKSTSASISRFLWSMGQIRIAESVPCIARPWLTPACWQW